MDFGGNWWIFKDAVWSFVLVRVTAGFTLFFKGDTIPAVIVLDDVHKGLHEHDAATGGAFEVFIGSGVGDGGDGKTWAFVFDGDAEPFGVDGTFNADLFGDVGIVSVFDRIDERFFQREPDTENISLGERSILQLLDDGFLDLQPGCGFALNHKGEFFDARHVVI